MTEPVLWADLQVPGQPPVPLTTDQWDDNIAGLAARVAALEALRDTVPNLGDIAVASGGQAVSVPLTDGTGAGPHNLPLNEFNPAGAWAAGATYARGDLVTVGEISAVATAPHVASTYAADLKAGLWVQDTAAADWMTERGVYDPTVPYSVGDAVLYSPDSGMRWQLWRASASDDPARVIPVGSAPGTDDATGAPYWSEETVALRSRQLSMRTAPGGFAPPDTAAGGRVASRRLGAPMSIPPAWAGSGGTIQPRNTSSAAVVLALRVNGTTVATLTIPPGQDHAVLIGAGAVVLRPGDLLDLVNAGPAIKATAISLGIAGIHV